MRPSALKRKNCLSLPDEISHRHEPFTPVGGGFHGDGAECDTFDLGWKNKPDPSTPMAAAMCSWLKPVLNFRRRTFSIRSMQVQGNEI